MLNEERKYEEKSESMQMEMEKLKKLCIKTSSMEINQISERVGIFWPASRQVSCVVIQRSSGAVVDIAERSRTERTDG